MGYSSKSYIERSKYDRLAREVSQLRLDIRILTSRHASQSSKDQVIAKYRKIQDGKMARSQQSQKKAG